MKIRIRIIDANDLRGKEPVLSVATPFDGGNWEDHKEKLPLYTPCVLEVPVYSSYREDEILYWEPVEIVREP